MEWDEWDEWPKRGESRSTKRVQKFKNNNKNMINYIFKFELSSRVLLCENRDFFGGNLKKNRWVGIILSIFIAC